MAATLRAPIAGPFQMTGTTGAVVNPDVHADIEYVLRWRRAPRLGPLSLLIRH